MKMTGNALRLGLALVLVGSAAVAGAADYYPVARIDTKAGYGLTVVQRAHNDIKACRAANDRFLEALKPGCESCRVRSRQCKTKLTDQEAAAIGGKALKSYSVSAPGVRIILSGATKATKPACEQIASQTSDKGSKSAKCLSPGRGE